MTGSEPAHGNLTPPRISPSCPHCVILQPDGFQMLWTTLILSRAVAGQEYHYQIADEAVREMTPSERRSEILHLLCKRRHETAINLSAELGVSERTIRADLVILSCYYPIQVVRGRFGGGIHLPDWFHMESRTLSSKQQVLLMKVRKTLSGDDLQVMNSILAQFALYWEYR